MKLKLVLLLLCLPTLSTTTTPVLRNPGLPVREAFVIHEYLDAKTGYVTSTIHIELKGDNDSKYYAIVVDEGGLYRNEINVNYADLTTISEKRIDLKDNKVVQSFEKKGDQVHFFNAEKSLDKTYTTNETNIYSPLAYLVAFRGFPFKEGNRVSFKTYMYAYGGVLSMNLEQIGVKTVSVKAGTFTCNVLALSVGGWQSLFAPEKYYFYYSVDYPYPFVKFEDMEDGKLMADELVRNLD